MFIAKAWVENPSGTTALAECTLTTGFAFDQSRAGLGTNASLLDTGNVTMTVVHTFDTAGQAILTCEEVQVDSNLNLYDAKITAIEINSLSNVFGG